MKEGYATLDSALFWLMVHLSPSFFSTMNTATDDRKPCLKSGLQSCLEKKKNLNFTKVWLVFICTCLSTCQNWMQDSAMLLCLVGSDSARIQEDPNIFLLDWWFVHVKSFLPASILFSQFCLSVHTFNHILTSSLHYHSPSIHQMLSDFPHLYQRPIVYFTHSPQPQQNVAKCLCEWKEWCVEHSVMSSKLTGCDASERQHLNEFECIVSYWTVLSASMGDDGMISYGSHNNDIYKLPTIVFYCIDVLTSVVSGHSETTAAGWDRPPEWTQCSVIVRLMLAVWTWCNRSYWHGKCTFTFPK